MTRRKKPRTKESRQIESVFNANYGANRSFSRRRKPSPPPIHDDISQCTFGRGRNHVTFVTDADGNQFLDITKIQRCPCGERKITLVSRVPRM